MKKTNLIRETFWTVIRENKGKSLLLLVMILAVVLLSLVPPQILKITIDQKLLTMQKEGLLTLAVLYLLSYLLIGVFDFGKAALLTIFGQKITRQLREQLTRKLERLGTTYFSEHTTGEITSRFTNEAENVNSLFTDGAVSMMIDCFKILGIIVSIWLFSAQLGILTLGLVPVIFFLSRFFQKRMLAAQVENLRQMGRVNSHISESLKNIRMIKSFHKEEYMEQMYGNRLSENFQTINHVNFYDSCYAPIIQMIRAVVISAVVVVASGKLPFAGAFQWEITVGMAAASMDLISNLFGPIETLGMELQNIQKGLSGIRRLNDFYCEKEEQPRHSWTLEEIRQHGAPEFVFEDVSFSYDGQEQVLSHISLQIPQGQDVLFTGRTGVGKTTLFRLIMGLLRPSEGRVTFHGLDVCEIPNGERRRLFGYVEQSFSFIRGTVLEQITLGDEQITREQVEKAMQFVGLHENVLRMAQGYDTMVHEESDFSQGQKQLLAIARAIVGNPEILLFDEVTANLDSATEARIMSVLQKAKSGRTVFSVSHRQTEKSSADRIVHLEKGKILD